MTTRARRERGMAIVEFGLVCMVLLPFLFALIEYGRLVFLWNTLPAVTRRAARAAAITDFTNGAALQALRRAALFSGSGALPLAPNVGSANVRIEYLWQDASGVLATVPMLPACPLANRVNCAREPRGASCISFVRVRLCGAGAGADCPPLAYEPLLPLVPVPAALPPASTVAAAESLGYTPGQAPCP